MPQVLRSVAEFRQWRRQFHTETIGFVPTMGALHAGHLSLIRASLSENDLTVVSIFVNPAQFGPNEDLDSYPRTFDRDCEKLDSVNDAIVVFAPLVSEMYPLGISLDVKQQKGAFVSVLGVSEQLEGVTRPQFFRGVATVVCKLFNVVLPTRAYFGQKDVQQTVVVKRMVQCLLMGLEIRVMPIVREESGLAMSSRNEYLSDELKEKCALIYKGLSLGQQAYEQGEHTSSKIIEQVQSQLTDPTFRIDYISIADKSQLTELDTVDPSKGAILSLAIYVTENDRTTRLIDNIIL